MGSCGETGDAAAAGQYSPRQFATQFVREAEHQLPTTHVADAAPHPPTKQHRASEDAGAGGAGVAAIGAGAAAGGAGAAAGGSGVAAGGAGVAASGAGVAAAAGGSGAGVAGTGAAAEQVTPAPPHFAGKAARTSAVMLFSSSSANLRFPPTVGCV